MVSRGVGVMVTAGTLALTLAGAASAAAIWEEDLREQILARHDCEVAFLSHIVERTIDGRKTVRALVHCEDQRRFRAWRARQSDPFTFEDCGSRDAKSC